MTYNYTLPAGFRLMDENTVYCPYCGATQLFGELDKQLSNGWVFCPCGAEEKINPGNIELEMDPDTPQALRFSVVFPENYRVKPSHLPNSAGGFTEELLFRKGSFPEYTLFDSGKNAVYQTVLTSPDPRFEDDSALLDLLVSRKEARVFFLIGAKAFAGPECYPIDTVFDLGLTTRFGYCVRVVNQFPFGNNSYKMAKSRKLVPREDLEAYLSKAASFLPDDLKMRIVELDQGLMFYLPELRLLSKSLEGDKELFSRLIAKAPVERVFAFLAAVKNDAKLRTVLRALDKDSNSDHIRRLIYSSASGLEKGHLNLPRKCLFWKAQCTDKFRFEPIYGDAMYSNLVKMMDVRRFSIVQNEKNLLWIAVYKRSSVVPLAALGFDQKRRRLVEWVDNEVLDETWEFENNLWTALESIAEKFKASRLEFIVDRDYLLHRPYEWDDDMLLAGDGDLPF